MRFVRLRRSPPSPPRRVYLACLAGLSTGVNASAFPAAAGPQGHLHRLQRRRANVSRRYSRATQRRQGVLVRIRRLDGRPERVSEGVGRLHSRISKLDATIEIVSERLNKTQQQPDGLQTPLD